MSKQRRVRTDKHTPSNTTYVDIKEGNSSKIIQQFNFPHLKKTIIVLKTFIAIFGVFVKIVDEKVPEVSIFSRLGI